MTFIIDYIWNPGKRRAPVNIHNNKIYDFIKCYRLNSPFDLTKGTETERIYVGFVSAHQWFSYERMPYKMDKRLVPGMVQLVLIWNEKSTLSLRIINYCLLWLTRKSIICHLFDNFTVTNYLNFHSEILSDLLFINFIIKN